MEALGKLRDKKLIRFEKKTSTGGRSGECWFPCYPERKPQPALTRTMKSIPSVQAPVVTSSVMSLAELFDFINSIGAKLERRGDQIIIDAPPEKITPALQAALKEHHDTVLSIYPTKEPTEVVRDDEEQPMTYDEISAFLDGEPSSLPSSSCVDFEDLDRLLEVQPA